MAAAAIDIVVRPWKRRDRSTVGRWPAVDLPQHWQQVEPTDTRRESFAVDFGELLVGRITLRDRVVDRARLGIYLHPDYLGMGIGTAAIESFCALAVELGLKRIDLDVAADNVRAIRCYEKCGFQTWKRVERSGFAFVEMSKQLCTLS